MCALWVVIFMGNEYECFILDQVSFPIPLLKLRNRKVMFYCHHPDKLLSTSRESWVMKLYRFFLDYIEEITTGMAQTIVVNSEYTRQIFDDNFPIIAAHSKKEESVGNVYNTHHPKILYPPINLKTFNKTPTFN